MIRRLTVAAGAAAIALLVVAVPAPAATIRMSGQQSTHALVADLVYFYRHEFRREPRFELSEGGTGAGIADTVRKISHAALVSRELLPDDPPGLVLTRLALSGVCLATNNTNPVTSMSRALLQEIVAGRVTSWSQVPGSTRTDPIVPVTLDPGTGAARVFEQVFIDDATPIGWNPRTLLTSLQTRDYLEQTPAAFAYLDLAFTGPVHEITYEGVPCTRATIMNGSYPAGRPIGIVTVGRPKGAVRRFLRWARTSPTARRVIATRYIPVSQARRTSK